MDTYALVLMAKELNARDPDPKTFATSTLDLSKTHHNHRQKETDKIAAKKHQPENEQFDIV